MHELLGCGGSAILGDSVGLTPTMFGSELDGGAGLGWIMALVRSIITCGVWLS